MFSVALSVGTPRGVFSRVYLTTESELRGIAPCGVRTFLLPRNASEEAILHPSKTGNSLTENPLAGKPAIRRVSADNQRLQIPAGAMRAA